MSQSTTEKPAFRILSFINDKEDAESKLKLKEAAAKIEKALAAEQATKGLIDRQIDDVEPLDAADDTRPLYQRLMDQKMQKQELIEDSQRLSNFVCKLDEDEVDFLKQVDQQKLKEEIARRREEMEAIEQYKRIMSTRHEEEEKLQKILTWGGSSKTDSIAKPETSTRGTRREKLSNLIRIVPKSTSQQLPPPPPTLGVSSADAGRDSLDAHKLSEDAKNQQVSQAKGINRLCADYSDDDDDEDDKDVDDNVGQPDNTMNDPNEVSEQVDSGRETRSSRRAANKADQAGQSGTSKPATSRIEPIDSTATNNLSKRKKQDNDSDSDPDESSKKECILRTDSHNRNQSQSVLKCIGILPSMSGLVSSFPDSSGDSSDSSNEDCDLVPLVTRVGRKAKQEHHEG